MKFQQIKIEAERIQGILSPHCERVQIAGSIRRNQFFCNDIDIVLIPETKEGTVIRTQGFINSVFHGICGGDVKRITKGRLSHSCKQINISLDDGVTLQLFMTTKERWGASLLTRTGSKEFCKLIFGMFKAKGFTSEGNIWVKPASMFGSGEERLEFSDEIQIFNYLGIEWVEPKKRNKYWRPKFLNANIVS